MCDKTTQWVLLLLREVKALHSNSTTQQSILSNLWCLIKTNWVIFEQQSTLSISMNLIHTSSIAGKSITFLARARFSNCPLPVLLDDSWGIKNNNSSYRLCTCDEHRSNLVCCHFPKVINCWSVSWKVQSCNLSKGFKCSEITSIVAWIKKAN